MSKQSVRKTLEEFISQCKEKHGDTYDYSESVYLGSYKKIGIKCRVHGMFWQWPNDHRNGRGCAFCSKNRVDPGQFVKDMKIWYPRYDFSEFVYTGAKSKSKIICPLHGEFMIRPNDLNFGHACKQCGMDKQQNTKVLRGIVTDPKDKTDYENYRRHVWRISNQQYKLYKEKINPINVPRSLEFHLDHIYSIQQGWVNGKSSEEIGDWTNLQMLEGKLNRQKSNK